MAKTATDPTAETPKTTAKVIYGTAAGDAYDPSKVIAEVEISIEDGKDIYTLSKGADTAANAEKINVKGTDDATAVVLKVADEFNGATFNMTANNSYDYSTAESVPTFEFKTAAETPADIATFVPASANTSFVFAKEGETGKETYSVKLGSGSVVLDSDTTKKNNSVTLYSATDTNINGGTITATGTVVTVNLNENGLTVSGFDSVDDATETIKVENFSFTNDINGTYQKTDAGVFVTQGEGENAVNKVVAESAVTDDDKADTVILKISADTKYERLYFGLAAKSRRRDYQLRGDCKGNCSERTYSFSDSARRSKGSIQF